MNSDQESDYDAMRKAVNGSCDGMTLRDYFAARMMIRELGEEIRPHRDYHYRNAAIRAYRMADAMLKVRENKE